MTPIFRNPCDDGNENTNVRALNGIALQGVQGMCDSVCDRMCRYRNKGVKNKAYYFLVANASRV